MFRWLGLALLLSSGCSGLLIIEEPHLRCTSSADCGLGKVCDLESSSCVESPGACSQERPDGDCPAGHSCTPAGVCICVNPELCSCDGGCSVDWCNCAPGDGCDDGECFTIEESGPGANSCAPTRPDGLCAGGASCCEEGARCCPADEVCVADFCVPNIHPCSDATPNGWCGEDLTCRDGRCVPTIDCACGSGTGTCCPNGEGCQGGACVVAACDATTFGGCPDDQVCQPGCEPIACSASHPLGSCSGGLECSGVGECIPASECRVDVDCVENVSYCSATNSCLAYNTCAVDEDCEVRQGGDYGQGYACVSARCEPRTTCALDSDCVPADICSEAGNCLRPPACDGHGDCPDTEFCSIVGQCIADGECRGDLDCLGSEYCASNNHCLVLPACAATIDCPPSHACNAGTCEPSGTACNSNDLVDTGCAPGDLFCCAPGGTCCPSGNICSLGAGVCVPIGECIDDGDCLSPDFACRGYVCVPTLACDNCAPEACRLYTDADNQTVEGCLPSGRCATDRDCSVGELCGAELTCIPNTTCGSSALDLGALVPPSVLIVLDRSASMQLCGAGDSSAGPCGYAGTSCSGSCSPICGAGAQCCGGISYDFSCNQGGDGSTTTRWTQALGAIDFITNGYAGQVNFGLSLYPDPQGGESCSTPCNYFCCSDRTSVLNGVIDVPVGSGTRAALMGALAAPLVPGGGTPTAPTLRHVVGLPDRGGLTEIDRANAVLLVTDGEAIGDTAVIRTCDAPCSDGVQNGDETDADCGGSCSACVDGRLCESNDDCTSRTCRGGVCRPASCADEQKNGSETAADCGGVCEPCADALGCSVPTDCASGVCTAGACATPSCTDGQKNGDETDLDCGGPCADCVVGDGCSVAADCASGVCQAGSCRAATCNDGAAGNGESDIDCGGPCGPCALTKLCSLSSDCQSSVCSSTCQPNLCANAVLDAGEVDIDCGGSCAPCGGGRVCSAAGDCESGVCRNCDDASEPNPQGCRVNAAIDQLHSASPRIKTFVVGFAFSGVSANLNCHAVHGHTARRGVGSCESLTPATCRSSTDACYYQASDQTSLSTALDDILSQVSSCNYNLPVVPPDQDRLFAYVDTSTALVRLDRYVSWQFDPSLNQVQFTGQACADIKSGVARPVVVYGCPPEGG